MFCALDCPGRAPHVARFRVGGTSPAVPDNGVPLPLRNLTVDKGVVYHLIGEHASPQTRRSATRRGNQAVVIKEYRMADVWLKGSCRSAGVRIVGCWLAGVLLVVAGAAARAEDPPKEPPADAKSADPPAPSDAPLQEPPREPAKLQPAKEWMPLTKDYDVWADMKRKQVIVGGRICLRDGWLEMFACPQGTKEHESIVAVNSPARFVHGGLLACGATPGPPVQFSPVYKPAGGTVIEVEVMWIDAAGQEQRVRAQEWVKHAKTGQPLQYPWVFAGSGFWVDEEVGERFYLADGGEFICVSNFSTAMLDLPVESSDANDTLLFTAFTERIPPLGTPVFLILTPQRPADGAATPPEASGEPAKKADAAASPPDNDEESKKSGQAQPQSKESAGSGGTPANAG